MTKAELINVMNDLDADAELFVYNDDGRVGNQQLVSDIEVIKRKNSGKQKIVFCYRECI